MKKLSKDLKRALAALAHQDAGEFLSMNDKMKSIGYGNNSENKSPGSPHLISNSFVKKRIALLSDGRDLNFPIEYAIDACKRQNADIDLLLHGEFDRSSISVIESHIRKAGIQSQRIQFGDNATIKIIEYISKQPSLIFMAATPDNSIARVLMEEILPSPEQRFAIPLVLIDEKRTAEPAKQSAA